MSNPAVTKLVRTRIGESQFWMDDNIGESIHIHLDDFRADLTTDELFLLHDQLIDVLNKLIQVDGFDIEKIDPVYLSMHLYKVLDHLESVEIDRVRVGDLIVAHHRKMGFDKFEKLATSRAVKALNGDTKENDDHRESHHIGQSSGERLSDMKKSIVTNGYPYNGQYIILFEDQNVVRDGQHRASCIYHELGNIEIPVMRLYFDDPSVATIDISLGSQIKRKIKNLTVRKLIQKAKGMAKKCRTGTCSLKNKLYFSAHKSELQKMESVYFQ